MGIAYLIEPTTTLEKEYNDMLKDWQESGEKLVPFVLKEDHKDFSKMVDKLIGWGKGINIDSTFVEHSTYWLMNEKNKILGVVNIRHRLNEGLLSRGGHIGYGITPSERRKGYATEILRLALDKAKELGIERALVTCDKDNIGSAKTITKNGGILESEILYDGAVIQRYWIEI